MHRLSELEFIKEHKDLFITGSTGTGKSYLVTALGYEACQRGYRVIYANTSKLMGQLKLAKAKGTILAELKRIERADVLILDDFGLQPFDSQSRVMLLDIIEDRHHKHSTIITSQIPVKDWYEIIDEEPVSLVFATFIKYRFIKKTASRDINLLAVFFMRVYNYLFLFAF